MIAMLRIALLGTTNHHTTASNLEGDLHCTGSGACFLKHLTNGWRTKPRVWAPHSPTTQRFRLLLILLVAIAGFVFKEDSSLQVQAQLAASAGDNAADAL